MPVDLLSGSTQDFGAVSPAQDLLAPKHEGMEHIPAPKPYESVIPSAISAAGKGLVSTMALPYTAAEFFIPGIKRLEELGGMKPDQRQERMQKTLGIKDVPIPTDIYGKPSKANEYIVKIAEFLGASALPGVGAVSMAERKALTATANIMGTTVAGTSAVEGKELGERHAETFGLTPERGGQIGELIGSFAGPGGVGLLSQKIAQATRFTGDKLKSIGVTGFGKDAQKAAAHKMLTDDIEASLKNFPKSQENLERAMDLHKKIEGFALPLPQASGAPGLIAMYREVTNKSPEALAKASKIDADNISSIQKYKDISFPKTKESILSAPRSALERETSNIKLKLANNDREIRALAAAHTSTVDNQVIGDKLRSLYWDSRNSTKSILNTQINKVYGLADKVGLRVDMTDVRDAVMKIVKQDESTFQDMPKIFRKVLNEYPQGAAEKIERFQVTPTGAKTPIWRTKTTPEIKGNTESSFQELHSLYKQSNQDWFDSIMAGNDVKARYISIIKDQLSNKLKTFERPEYGGVAEEFKKFNSDYAKYSQIYKRGIGADIAAAGKRETDSEDIVRKIIFQKGKSKGVQEFFDIYGNDKNALNTLHDGILDVMYRETVSNGEVNPTKLSNFLSDKGFGKSLDQLPQLKAKLTDVNYTAKELANRRLLLDKELKVNDGSVIAKIARMENPEKVIDEALKTPSVMRGLLVASNTTQAKQAVARGIADRISKMDDPLGYVLTNHETLKPVMDSLGKEHFSNLKTIAEAEEAMGRVKAPTHVELSQPQDIGQRTIGTTVKGLMSTLRRLNTPLGVSPEYAIADIGGKFIYKFRAEELARLREAAMTDPDMAKIMASLVKNKNTAGGLLKLKELAMAHGITVASVESVKDKK